MPMFLGLFERAERAGDPWLFLLTAGFLLWSLAYLLIIAKCFAERTYGVPLPAICLNLTWEFYFAVVAPPAYAGGPWGAGLGGWLVKVWFLLDLIIFGQLLAWGRNQQHDPVLRRYFYVVIAGLLILAYFGQTTFMVYNFDPDGTQIGWIINLIMSIFFIGLFFQRPRSEGLSFTAAWAKLLGSGAMGIVLVGLHGKRAGFEEALAPTGYYDFERFLVAAVAFFDLLYVALLWRRRSRRTPGGEPAA